ncbi:MAG TPA: hypothetical protein VGS19_15230 [Streptosporangiaceae bacterium]|nr:hypothetical protein [Streptosporangiaceae bacterium]
MRTATSLLRLAGLHVVPGIICLVASVALLSVWETRRLSRFPPLGRRPWLLPAVGLTLGAVSVGFIAARFLAIA